MKKCSIVIPFYKTNPSEDEVKSLLQCFRILNKYEIVFVCPNNINTEIYEKNAVENNVIFSFLRLEPEHFVTIDAYNQLMLRADFYKHFEGSEYILIYQLDAWVFKDELEYWCDKGYDYIGAPWFNDIEDENSGLMSFSGNGGFSLRKISSFLQVLKSQKGMILSLAEVFKHYKKRRFFSNIFSIPQFIFTWLSKQNRDLSVQKVKYLAEDSFYAFYAKKFFKDFSAAPSDVASYFAFEAQPKKLYETTKQLPFGCHNLKRYDYGFWSQFLEETN